MVFCLVRSFFVVFLVIVHSVFFLHFFLFRRSFVGLVTSRTSTVQSIFKSFYSFV